MSRSALITVLSFALLALIQTGSSEPLTTAFTFQGALTQLGAPASGDYDLQFSLYDTETGGAALAGSPLFLQDVAVVDGLFTVQLDFGIGPFSGDHLWLEIGVREGNSSGAYTLLAPRQALTAVPYALHAENVALGSVGSEEVVPGQVQLRISGTCPAGSSIRTVAADGSVSCQADTDTRYEAGQGLTLAGTTISVDTTAIQARVLGPCAPGTYLTDVAADGTVVCAPDLDTTYQAGTGLTLQDTTFSVDTSAVQSRVTGTCQSGTTFAAINVDGTVVCEDLPGALPTTPRLLAGFAPSAAVASGSGFFGWIAYPAAFSAPPIVALTIDEGLDDNGATWLRTRRETEKRLGVRASAATDGAHWLALDAGVHTIDGKMVVALKQATVSNNDTVMFGATFAIPPVVFLAIDESGDDNGTVQVRAIDVTQTGVQVWTNSNSTMDGLHVIAMEAGDYSYGPYRWRAETFEPQGCVTDCAIALTPTLAGTPDVLLQIYDTNNNGAVWVRVLDTGSDQIRFRMDNTTEFVHYLAVTRSD